MPQDPDDPDLDALDPLDDAPSPPDDEAAPEARVRKPRPLDPAIVALFPEALASREEFRRVGEALEGTPLLANMTEFGVSPLVSIPDLADLGFSAVLYPVTLMRLAMKAMEAGLAIIASEGTQESLLDLMQSREELYELLGYDPRHPDAHLAGPAAARTARHQEKHA